MQLNENSTSVDTPSVAVVADDLGIELHQVQPVKQPRNQHLKVDEPKNRQFTARCTESEHRLISAAMAANGCADIVRLMLFSINLHRKDVFSSFKLR
ncbi:hypothetical protein ACFSR6_03380 [Pedobacter vanadiisoli]|uniref:Uncharacterized protein n=1 Tax=Pedobacter vanadiisoli TaxID=1761975 RepID=A0ABW5MFF1_9SPHI